MRSTKGNISMSVNSPMLGFNALDKSTTGIVVLTNNGYVNHVSLSALPLSKRARAGATMIKLKKGDTVYKMFDCKDDDVIRIFTGRAMQEVQVGSIPYGASTASGKRMFPNMDRAELIRV
jgi:DNA gyrase/topoisomerase IV subunit A